LEEIDVEEEEVRDPLSEEVIAYKRHYVLKSESKPEEDKPIETFFREWVRRSRTEILNYVYKKYPEYAKYSMTRAFDPNRY